MKNNEPLTIEELRFALVGDDDSYMSRILHTLFMFGVDGFGEGKHYFCANYSARFFDRLLKSSLSLAHNVRPHMRALIPPSIGAVIGVQIKGLIDSDDKLDLLMHDKYDITATELEWVASCTTRMQMVVIDSGWKPWIEGAKAPDTTNVMTLLGWDLATGRYLDSSKKEVQGKRYTKAVRELEKLAMYTMQMGISPIQPIGRDVVDSIDDKMMFLMNSNTEDRRRAHIKAALLSTLTGL